MRILRALIAAALTAALLVLTLPASADECPADDPDCHLSPLQSRQVNPFPSSSSIGEWSEFDGNSTQLVTDFTIPTSLGSPAGDPIFVEPAPLPSGSGAPAFDRLDLRMRYQAPDPTDATCGVQALGMALDGLGAPGPASSALLDYLQNNRMTYGFGTGVEELAFAAQSFGYADSLPFYGGSLALLQSELAAGRPVVVDLGANGPGQPGHFVTVTGVSPDGAWIAYNDPLLGEQTLPAAAFLELWSLQGYAGVTVGPSGTFAGAASAAEPTEPNPFNAMPLLMLVAGLMALISNAGLGLWRKGIGGMLAEGAGFGGGSGGSTGPTNNPGTSRSPSGSSKGESKEKKRKSDSPVPAPAVIRAETAFEAAGPPPPETEIPPAVARAEEAFEEAWPPDLAYVESAFSADSDSKIETPQASTAPAPSEAESTPQPQAEDDPVANQPPPDNLPSVPDDLLDPFPSIALTNEHEDLAALPLGLIEFGHHYGWTYEREADDSTAVTPYNWTKDVFGLKLQFSKDEMSLKATLPFGETEAYETEDGGMLTHQQSASIKVTWNGWNTTSEVAYNSIDYEISGGSGAAEDNSVSGYQGIYAKDKPFEVVALGEAVKASVAGVILGVEWILGIGSALGDLLGGGELLPQ
jgi:hypothetical protein